MPTFNELIQSGKPVLVDFHATWCGPCKQLSPVIERVAGILKDKVKVLKVDVDRNQAAAQAYKIQGVPTMILFKKGQIIWRSSGFMDERTLQKTIEQFL